MRTQIFRIASIFSLFAFQLLAIACSSDSGEGTSGEEGKDTVLVTDTVVQKIMLGDTADSAKVVDTLKLRAEMAQKEFEKIFRKYDVEGAFLLFDPQNNVFYQHNPERGEKPFLPASTFKILNSLIALETGVISDTNIILKWDGKEREFQSWNQDHNMKTAFKNSVVWFYQDLARKIGEKRMQHYVNEANYGNKNIDGGIDKFWLDGKLRISMEGQIVFLRKLYQGRLPFTWETMQKVKSIMEYEVADSSYVIRGKTGWARPEDAQEIGWFVGWIELPDNKGYYFALNIDVQKPEDIQARPAIVKEALKAMQII